jgi:hypothetical protein
MHSENLELQAKREVWRASTENFGWDQIESRWWIQIGQDDSEKGRKTNRKEQIT